MSSFNISTRTNVLKQPSHGVTNDPFITAVSVCIPFFSLFL